MTYQFTPEWDQASDQPFQFVFGSNEAGIHGAGAAADARTLGALIGKGFGPNGSTFAIPTKDWAIQTLPLIIIQNYVDRFLAYARQYPNTRFMITCIGCGLAGHRHEDIAPMFLSAPDNCWFDTNWKHIMNKHQKYWGTF